MLGMGLCVEGETGVTLAPDDGVEGPIAELEGAGTLACGIVLTGMSAESSPAQASGSAIEHPMARPTTARLGMASRIATRAAALERGRR